MYAVCRKWGVAIVEDDPYYYLQYGNGDETERRRRRRRRREGGRREQQQLKGLHGLGASYLSLDVDGRVIRLDSFSKVLFPGVRLGWATAPRAVIDKLVCHLHGVALGAPPLAQVLTSALLLRGWGGGDDGPGGLGGPGGRRLPDGGGRGGAGPFAGFERHVQTMQREYRRRASVAHAAASRHLAGLASWRRPAAGMFLWATLAADLAPVADAALARARSAGVVVVPGAYAHCSGDRERPCACFRLSFAGASDEALEEGDPEARGGAAGDAGRDGDRVRGLFPFSLFLVAGTNKTKQTASHTRELYTLSFHSFCHTCPLNNYILRCYARSETTL